MTPQEHIKQTSFLASQLRPKNIHRWLVTQGYFPEPYVLPPCFEVTQSPTIRRTYFPLVKKYSPTLTSCYSISFPKNSLSDRSFSIVSPQHNHEIAKIVANNWRFVTKRLFNPKNKVSSYSFPIPLDSKTPGQIGSLRSGRMIYEYIEMAENDLASVAHRFKYIFTTDVKNFYPSIYTHSIAWALHGKERIHHGKARWDYKLIGNRLDKLFQSLNDGCTNGIPIGPAISDFISEIILSAVDTIASKSFPNDIIVVRFKDDYRILCNSESEGRKAIKALQATLREFHLELNETKTETHILPEGLFRKWVSRYHYANPYPKRSYSFKRFKEVYLAVVAIDKELPGTGIVDRFLSDIAGSSATTRLKFNYKSLPKIISMLVMLGRIRIKAYPMILAVIEALLQSPSGKREKASIAGFLRTYFRSLLSDQPDNAYLLVWLTYFLRANGFGFSLGKAKLISHPLVRSTFTSRSTIFRKQRDFKIFTPISQVIKKRTLHSHLAIFDRNDIAISSAA